MAAIKAVAEVESLRQAFYDDGFPVILFERHKFRAFTHSRYNKSHPHLSGPQGNYGKAGQNQRNKFNEAFHLDPDAAMKSCSWGMFQIMGFNYELCGYNTVGEFVDAMKSGVDAQLDAFVSYVLKRSLADELRRKDFYLFAEAYNGPNQEENDYSDKMERAYKKYAKENIDCSNSAATPAANQGTEQGAKSALNPPDQAAADKTVGEVKVTKETETKEGTQTIEATAKNEQDVNTPAVVQSPEPYMGVGFWGVIKRDLTAATGGNLTFSAISEYAQQASGWPEWVVGLLSKLAIGVLIATVGYFIFRVVHYLVDTWKKNHKTKIEAEAATSTVRKDIQWQ